MSFWSQFHGPNAAYAAEWYEKYQIDPNSVDPETRAIFDKLTPPSDSATTRTAASADVEKIVATVNLAQAIREHGHHEAQLDPLGAAPKGDPALELETYGLSEQDL